MALHPHQYNADKSSPERNCGPTGFQSETLETTTISSCDAVMEKEDRQDYGSITLLNAPGKLTTDRILALCVHVERRLKFQKGFLAACVDLKKAFDSVHCEVLWDLLQISGIPARITELMADLYSGTESAVMHEEDVSNFYVDIGMSQRCILTPNTF
ncbi:uncharacterized protein LOC143019724 [Oratosquilla oratoria]|uniref:uncharacterized protein LOC143019724 n=1 Tax=Oratosquilla oratoria TaxID=337810 RepID=UPI003F76ACB0